MAPSAVSGRSETEITKEVWKPVRLYEGKYEVSNLGKVRSLPRQKRNHDCYQAVPEKIPKQSQNQWGYMVVYLSSDGKTRQKFVHRLVAEAFLNRAGNDQVNHLDGIKTNNCVDNLEWCNGSDNMKHAFAHGLHSGARKVRLVEENLVFNSLADAARYVGGKRESVYRCLSGRNKTHRGLHFVPVKYSEEESE